MLFLFILGIFFTANVFADEQETNTAITSYTKSVEKAELNFTKAESAGNIDAAYKRVSKELSSLDKKYDRYSDEIKSNPEIEDLYKRHSALNDKLPLLEKMAKLQKVVSPYERKIKQLEKKYITENSNDFVYLADQLEILDKHYGYIPEENRNDVTVLELKKRHDTLVSLQSDKETAYMDDTNAKWEKSANEKEMSNLSAQLRFDLLEAGKNNKGLTMTDLNSLEEDMPAFKQFAQDCSGKYAAIVAEDPEAKELADLANNREKYRDQLKYATYKRDLDKRIGVLKSEIDSLTTNNYIESDYLDLFLYEFDQWHNDIIKFFTDGYSSLGKPAPTEKFDELKGLKVEFEQTLDNYVSNSDKWDGSNFEKPTSAFKKKADLGAKKMGLKLVEAGYEDNWFIEKDEYNLPVKKYAPGYVLLKKPGESFYRCKAAYFYKVFDGEKYEEASYVQFQNLVTPVKK